MIQRYFFAQKTKRKEAGFLAREKISDSLLDGFRAESNRKSKDGIRDVDEAVPEASGGDRQRR